MKAITSTNVVKNIVLSIFSLTTFGIYAQEEEAPEKKLSFSGSADVYFRTNITGPNGEEAIAPASSFANLNGFALGMANIIASYEGEKVGVVADLVFGPRGEEAVFGSLPSNNIVNQLYAYWNVSETVTLTMGNFNTFLGYEVISPVANFNYSTSYMFSYGPFSHTGLKVDLALSDDFSLMFAIMNSTDETEFNLDGSYTAGAQIGYKGQFLNFIYGEQTNSSDALFQIDYTGGFDLTDQFFLGINATYQDTDGSGFYGAAIYPQYAATENFSLGLRAEYFKEFDGGVGALGVYDNGGDASVIDLTLTGSYTVGNLIIKPELRLDTGSEELFLDGDLNPDKSLSSFLVAAIYSF